MKLKEQLNGYRLDWLAGEVITPMKGKGMNINTFYSYVYKEIEDSPVWLLKELSRLTGRKIKK